MQHVSAGSLRVCCYADRLLTVHPASCRHLLEFGKMVKEGCKTAGLVGLQYNTIGISDAITMGGQGMRFSLPSRDIIADSIESVTIGQSHDANVSVRRGGRWSRESVSCAADIALARSSAVTRIRPVR